MEVLSLQSGQPLCRYKLVKDTQTLGDVNNDGVIDRVTSYFASQAHLVDLEIPPCSAVVTSNSKVLFAGSICDASWLFGSYFTWSDTEHGDEPLPVSPLLVKSPPHRSGVFRHLMGRNVRELRRGYDSVFLTSVGKVTSFGPYGELNWQVVWLGSFVIAYSRGSWLINQDDQDFKRDICTMTSFEYNY